MTVRVVTDSAADIPDELTSEHGITVVPLTIRFGDETYTSGVDLSTDQFWQKLKSSSASPATAAPSAGDFQTAYQKLLSDGASGVVSIHLSSKLSATYQSAVVAAQEIGEDKVKVVDTLAVSAGTGLIALEAARKAQAGASLDDVATTAADLCGRVRLYGAIDTLEYLRRGGRIGGAQALLGTMLKFKPVISLQDGIVEPVTRVRTLPKALEHIAGIIAQDAAQIDQLVVMDGDAPEIGRFVSMLAPTVDVPSSDVWKFGPIVGAHGGPGLIGVAYLLSGPSGNGEPPTG